VGGLGGIASATGCTGGLGLTGVTTGVSGGFVAVALGIVTCRGFSRGLVETGGELFSGGLTSEVGEGLISGDGEGVGTELTATASICSNSTTYNSLTVWEPWGIQSQFCP